jgi:hypothetical protein
MCILTFICLRATTLSYDVAHRTVRSWRQNLFDCFSRWPWNTLHNYMFGVDYCRKEWGESAIRWGAWSTDCGHRGRGRETVNRKRKLSAIFLQPIQNSSHMSHVLLLCISFLRVFGCSHIVTSELVRLLFAHNVLRNSYNTRPLLCVRITCYVTVITQAHCYACACRVT